MKHFVLTPPARLTAARPLEACDDEAYASSSAIVEMHTAYLYSDEDVAAVEAMGIGELFIDGEGWTWTRTQ